MNAVFDESSYDNVRDIFQKRYVDEDLFNILSAVEKSLIIAITDSREVIAYAEDGSYYWVFTTIVPLCSSRGNVKEYISIRYDISKEKKIEDESRLAQKEIDDARVAQETSERFVSALTHDLRSPLTSAMLSAQFIERKLQ